MGILGAFSEVPSPGVYPVETIRKPHAPSSRTSLGLARCYAYFSIRKPVLKTAVRGCE